MLSSMCRSPWKPSSNNTTRTWRNWEKTSRHFWSRENWMLPTDLKISLLYWRYRCYQALPPGGAYYGLLLSVCPSVPFAPMSAERKVVETSDFAEISDFVRILGQKVKGQGHVGPLKFRTGGWCIISHLSIHELWQSSCCISHPCVFSVHLAT